MICTMDTVCGAPSQFLSSWQNLSPLPGWLGAFRRNLNDESPHVKTTATALPSVYLWPALGREFFCFSLRRQEDLLPQLLSLAWPCDLLWPIKRSNVPVLSHFQICSIVAWSVVIE